MENSCSPYCLYIFDTDEKVFSQYNDAFSHAGTDVCLYGPGGRVAVESCCADVPYVLLVDMAVVQSDDSALREIEKHRNEGAVIIVAGDGDDFDSRLRAVRLGAKQYLSKPVLINELLVLLADYGTSELVGGGYRVLLVDDDEIHGEYIGLVLEDAGVLARFESEPNKALRALEEFDPELILLDLYMPGCSGLELARLIRQNEKYTYIPIVFLSSETDVDIQLEAMSVGGDDFISKPVDPNYLIKSVQARAKRARYQSSISDRLKMTLRELEAQKFSLDQHSIVSITDRDGCITYVNDKFMEVSKYSMNEMLGQDHRILNSGYHSHDFFKDLWSTILHGEVWRGEIRNRSKNGDYYWVNTSIVPFLDERGEPYQFVSIRTDISHIKKAERELSAILNNMQDTFFRTTLDGVVLMVSPSIQQLIGYSQEEVVGRSMADFLREPRQKQQLFDALQQEGGELRDYELELRKKESGVAWVSTNIQFYSGEDGSIAGLEGTIRDITALKHSEVRVRRLAAAVEQSTDSIVIIDTKGNVEYINPAFEKISGYGASEALGGAYGDLLGSSNMDFERKVWPKVVAGKLWKSRVSYRHKVEGGYEEDVVITPIYDNEHRIINYISVGRDVTRETIIEDRLRKAEKMQAIGTLAGGIAHDFNNILASISGYTEMTMDDLRDDSLGHDNLLQVLKASERAKALVEQILTFSRQSEVERKAFQPALVIKEVIKLLRASLPSSIKIDQQVKAVDQWVEMDPTQFHQVVMNLCVNASHAIGEQPGMIKIELDVEKVVTHIGKGAQLLPGKYICLRVSDTGSGMEPELMARIFDPFFTTKDVGEGTGMGLAVVDGIISGVGGSISANSEPGKGAVFTVMVPLAISSHDAPAEDGVHSIDRGHGHILFVDDEELLVNMATQMLTRMGYEVTGYTDSQQALGAFAAQPDRYDLLITDQTMPNMTGEMLVREILKIREGVPVIMCTGYSEGFSAEQAMELGIKEYLMKPLRRYELAEAIQRELCDLDK